MYELVSRKHAAEISAFLDNHSIFNGNFLLTFGTTYRSHLQWYIWILDP
jgi:hypothetical protein